MRAQAREDRAEAMKIWHKEEEQRKIKNAAQRLCYKEALKAWETKKAKAKADKQKYGVPRPN